MVAFSRLRISETGDEEEEEEEKRRMSAEDEDEGETEATENASHNKIEFANIGLFGGAIRCNLPINFIDASSLRPVPDNQELWVAKQNLKDGCFIMELLEYQDDVKDANAIQYFFDDLASCNAGAADADTSVAGCDDEESGHCSSSLNCWLDSSHIVLRATSSRVPGVLSEDGFLLKDLLRANRDSDNQNSKRSVIANAVGQSSVHANGDDGNEVDEDVDVVVCTGRGVQFVPAGKIGSVGEVDIDIRLSGWVRFEMCLFRLVSVQTDLLITLHVPLHKKPGRGRPVEAGVAPTRSSLGVLSDMTLKENHSDVFLEIIKHFKVVDWSLFA